MRACRVRACCAGFSCAANVAAPEIAMACLLEHRAEYLAAAANMAARFWLASFALVALILCLDIYERRLSLALPIAGWVVFLWGVVIYRNVMSGTPFYHTDCSVPLLYTSQYVL